MSLHLYMGLCWLQDFLFEVTVLKMLDIPKMLLEKHGACTCKIMMHKNTHSLYDRCENPNMCSWAYVGIVERVGPLLSLHEQRNNFSISPGKSPAPSHTTTTHTRTFWSQAKKTSPNWPKRITTLGEHVQFFAK